MTGKDYMARAIEIAKRGTGRVNPNPLVGAVIVKDGIIIGEGYHEYYGGLHAERNAIAHLSESAEGAEIYVTLEPCCHYGKQPPCTQALIESGIKKVYIGSSDPNPLVAGKGVQILREAGIEVVENFMKEECDALNPVFFHFITTNEPYIALKYAMTVDGKIATRTGKSQWITAEEARHHVHELRNAYAGILVGIETVMKDDPMLNCRIEGGRDPVRIVMDTHLRISEESQLVCTADKVPLKVVYCPETCPPDTEEKAERLRNKGVEVIAVCADEAGEASIPEMLKELGKRKIDGILVEGGGTVHAAFIQAGKVQKVYAYIGAKIFGGQGIYTPVKGVGVSEVSDALNLKLKSVERIGQDILACYEADSEEQECLQE